MEDGRYVCGDTAIAAARGALGPTPPRGWRTRVLTFGNGLQANLGLKMGGKKRSAFKATSSPGEWVNRGTTKLTSITHKPTDQIGTANIVHSLRGVGRFRHRVQTNSPPVGVGDPSTEVQPR